jgi:signal transduction histidine kinase
MSLSWVKRKRKENTVSPNCFIREGAENLTDRGSTLRSAGLDTALELHGQAPDVPAGVQLAVYRLVQEALTNTLKHGGAGARACVRLSFEPGELRVDVNDDGVGSTAPAAAGGVGGGLPGMRERVRAYGGDVQAGPRQPSGWAVTARLPLDNGGTT